MKDKIGEHLLELQDIFHLLKQASSADRTSHTEVKIVNIQLILIMVYQSTDI